MKTKTLLNFRADTSWLERLDAWIAKQELQPSRSEVIRVAVDRFIEAQGAEKAKQERETA